MFNIQVLKLFSCHSYFQFWNSEIQVSLFIKLLLQKYEGKITLFYSFLFISIALINLLEFTAVFATFEKIQSVYITANWNRNVQLICFFSQNVAMWLLLCLYSTVFSTFYQLFFSFLTSARSLVFLFFFKLR